MELKIPVEIVFDDVNSVIDEIGKLQKYKLFEGDDMTLVDVDDVADVLTRHVKAREAKEPSIDAVQVIRCKDCKYWHREIYNGIELFNFSSCDLNHHGDGRNFYCADAEGKEK